MDHSHFLAHLTGHTFPGRYVLRSFPKSDASWTDQASALADYCIDLYSASVSGIRTAYLDLAGKDVSEINNRYCERELFPGIKDCCFPYIGIDASTINPDSPMDVDALGPFDPALRKTNYSSTIAARGFLKSYITSEIVKLLEHGYTVECGLSVVPIPFLYALDQSNHDQIRKIESLRIRKEIAKIIPYYFAISNTVDVEDGVIDGTHKRRNDSIYVNIEYSMSDAPFWSWYVDYLRNRHASHPDHAWINGGDTHAAIFESHGQSAHGILRQVGIPERLAADTGLGEPSGDLGYFGRSHGFPSPLSYFDGTRTEYSMARIKHYTKTSPENFQPHILLSNYHRYVERFLVRVIVEIYTRGQGTLVVPPSGAPGSPSTDMAFGHEAICRIFNAEQPDLLARMRSIIFKNHEDKSAVDHEAEAEFRVLLQNLIGQPNVQMPAYHYMPDNADFKFEDGAASGTKRSKDVFENAPLPGISLVNLGVGPSNARTITDHLAVLRPSSWMMVGHCAGIRVRQKLGDYVIANSYIRRDGVLDTELPLDAPAIAHPTIIEALERAIRHHSPISLESSRTDDGPDIEAAEKRLEQLKSISRTGTVWTTGNRNWEVAPSEDYWEQFEKYRVVAVDMESGTVAANAFRCRVPQGSFLCISDKPLLGVVKMSFIADDFYKTQISKHLDIALDAVKWLEFDNFSKTELLRTRFFRGKDDPPWR